MVLKTVLCSNIIISKERDILAIKNSIDFSYAINKITSKVEPAIIEQGAILESEKFNKTYNAFEKKSRKRFFIAKN